MSFIGKIVAIVTVVAVLLAVIALRPSIGWMVTFSYMSGFTICYVAFVIPTKR